MEKWVVPPASRIGIQDETDNDVRSLCYFGKGINLGVHTDGYLFINEEQVQLPSDFSWSQFQLEINTESLENGFKINVQVSDDTNHSTVLSVEGIEKLHGLVSLINNHALRGNYAKGTQFWFDDIRMEGSMVQSQEEASFGPILWSMYTLSKGQLKMTAQMPPLGPLDEQNVQLQLKKGSNWETIGEEAIMPDARIAVFKLENWDDTKDQPYRLVYNEKHKDGSVSDHHYEGVIRRDPVDRTLKFGGLTCQNGYGFPYRPVSENLAKQDPDMLFFSGDQIYEGNGGYRIIRFPAERAIVNYLGKWYMFGWAFGDLMRDRPTVCLPDDHEVYQGNLWGEGGRKVSLEEWQNSSDDVSGFVEPVEMVNVVTKTNCAHLPDPYDPTPMNKEFLVYYTDLVYGRVSFAIVADRFYKSGPERVSYWEGRRDHVKEPIDPNTLEKADLIFLGERQLAFLEKWVEDWKGADMKVVLSQTIFTNAATHHGGNKMYLLGDLDSGGWPKMGRDKAISLMRKAHAFHICGDQHIPMMIQYGIDNYQDAGWVFCTPAIATGYERRVQHDLLGIPVVKRPDHDLPNTGYYTDFFQNPNYVYAVANPIDDTQSSNRYQRAQNRASGFGMIHFDQQAKTIKSESFPFLDPDLQTAEWEQHPGWPHTVDQQDNYGQKAVAFLPTLKISGDSEPVVGVINESNGELVYMLRVNGPSFSPKVFAKGTYTIKIGNPETDQWQVMEGVKAMGYPGQEEIEVKDL